MHYHYVNSWEIYKAHSEVFKGDYPYYLELCKGQTVLETFAGYGRLTNYLIENNIELETIEIEPNFAQFINLPAELNHICNVLDFETNKQYDRVIAAYDSISLLTQESDIIKFLQKTDAWLKPGGIASFSYYHHDNWPNAKGYEFEFKGKKLRYKPAYDLSQRENKKGVWIDQYLGEDINLKYEYPIRLYEDSNCLIPFLKDTNLELINTIYNYNHPDIKGWVEFVLVKR